MKIKLNNIQYEVESGKTIFEQFGEFIDNTIIAAVYNNKVVSLNEKLVEDGEIKFLTRHDRDGRKVFIRGVLYLMTKAFNELYPNVYLTVYHQLANAMYCASDNSEITQEMIDNVKNRIYELSDKDLPIRKVEMTRKEAEVFYEKNHTLKGKLQMDAQNDIITLYYCEDYFNYFFGVMPISTGFDKLFDIVKFNEGFLIEYPNILNSKIVKSNKTTQKIVSAFNEYTELYKLGKISTVYHLNNTIKAGRAKDLILFSEAVHEKKIAEIASKIKAKKDVKMVLIAGPSSSGKTTFASKLGMALMVQGLWPVMLSVDNYFVEREDNPVDEAGNLDFECLDAVDKNLLNKQLTNLLKGEEVDLPEFNFKTGHKQYLGKKLKMEEDTILIIEGIHCLNDELTSQIPKEKKFKVYISDLTVLNIDYYNRISTTDTRLLRRLIRDYQFRNYSVLHTLKMWNSVNKGEQKNIFPYQEQADAMFNSSILYEISAMRPLIEPLLKEIDNSNPEYGEAVRLLELMKYFEPFCKEEIDLIPNNSLLREFVGGSIYDIRANYREKKSDK